MTMKAFVQTCLGYWKLSREYVFCVYIEVVTFNLCLTEHHAMNVYERMEV